ncbi:uncharacterized protein LOC116297740 [Actinia tenebrosa]|uniref:Probable quinone oxidoreductase n=1 Tax=Actinia tenebrosa TaxID=6105 RepID=A0A6P8HZU0_ACTTE|nr:uncharacterized protein LOC116297740 [Actinia tenebrosa]
MIKLCKPRSSFFFSLSRLASLPSNIYKANMSMKAAVIHEYGDSSKFCYEDVAIPEPRKGEVLIKNLASGVNFLDVYHRMAGNAKDLPKILGVEAAGIVEKLGPDTEGVDVGARVAFFHVGAGSYAQFSCIPANRVVPVPEGISLDLAASVMVQGMTAHYMVKSVRHLKPGVSVLIHAVAGGTGSFLCQVAKHAGAYVIGTCSTEAKAAKAKAAGADEVILYSQKDFVEETMRITDGKGVNVIYDSVGKDTFSKGFGCLAPKGMMVSYGSSSGTPDQVDIPTLGKASHYVTRPSLVSYISSVKDLRMRSSEVFQWLLQGDVKLSDSIILSLSEVKKAHDIIESRGTMGKILLRP